MGWTTALGDGLEETWSSLLRGDSGLRTLPGSGRLRNDIAAPACQVDLGAAPSVRLRDLARTAAQAALADASVPTAEVLVVAGTSLGAVLDEDNTPMCRWVDDIAAELGTAGPALPVSTACSTGSDAIALAAAMTTVLPDTPVLCGGADVLTTAKRLGHSALATMTPTRMRPFDQHRDGMLPGEGAGFLVLESESRARGRKAVIKGWICGAASSNDGAGMTAPDTTGTGVARAVRRALRLAGTQPQDIAAVSAHGTGTGLSDTTEIHALNDVFTAAEKPVVFALKSALGHTLGATGALQTIALLLALRDGVVPPIQHLDRPDPTLRLPLARHAPTRLPDTARSGVSLTLGFGGFNTCLVVEKAGHA
jgi:3-oxoacyl-[acyl-carrier-protein] synthase II